jgi:hypothetical protein
MPLSFCSPFTMSTVLSIHLLEQIIDELAQDKPALCACASASSVLRPRARHHLFSWIYVNADRVSALADLLEADPVLGENVLSPRADVGQPDAWFGAPRTGLCALLSGFPRLAALHLFGVDFRRMDAGALAAAFPASPRQLMLASCHFASDARLVALLRATPHLRGASLVRCLIHPAEAPEHERYAPMVELESLEAVAPRRTTYVCQPWFSVVSMRRLVSLKVTLQVALDIPFWQGWINQAGVTMRNLVFDNCNPSGKTLCHASASGSSYKLTCSPEPRSVSPHRASHARRRRRTLGVVVFSHAQE